MPKKKNDFRVGWGGFLTEERYPHSLEHHLSFFARAGHWLTLSVAMISLSKSISILDCSSILLSLLSSGSSRNASSGFPHCSMACFLNVRKTTNHWRIDWPGQSVDYYCQYYNVPVPSHSVYMLSAVYYLGHRVELSYFLRISAWAGHRVPIL